LKVHLSSNRQLLRGDKRLISVGDGLAFVEFVLNKRLSSYFKLDTLSHNYKYYELLVLVDIVALNP